jgi:hypothetical protein
MRADAVVAAAADVVVGPVGEVEDRSARLHLNPVEVETAREYAVRAADVAVVVADARVATVVAAPVHDVVAAASPALSRWVKWVAAVAVAIGAEAGRIHSVREMWEDRLIQVGDGRRGLDIVGERGRGVLVRAGLVERPDGQRVAAGMIAGGHDAAAAADEGEEARRGEIGDLVGEGVAEMDAERDADAGVVVEDSAGVVAVEVVGRSNGLV